MFQEDFTNGATEYPPDEYDDACENGTAATNYKHIPMKAALDASVHCIRCGQYLGESN